MKITKKGCLLTGVLTGVLVLIVLGCCHVVMQETIARRCRKERAEWAAKGIYFTMVTRESENRYQENYVGPNQSFFSSSPDERVYWTKDCQEDANRSAIAVNESKMSIHFNDTGVYCDLRTIAQ